jgi:flagellar hook-associated protein 3 FlgL
MRISDRMMTQGFTNSVSKTKESINKLNTQILTEQKVNKASDNPSSASKILRLGVQLSKNSSYSQNITNSLSFLDETTFALESVQSEVTDVLTKLTELNNETNTTNYDSYADQIDLALNSIIDLANSESEGRYIFGGTDYSEEPYGYTSDETSVESKVDTSGDLNVKVSSNITQTINISGTDVFGTVLSQSGNIDSSMAVGDTYTTSGTVYNSSKEPYTVSLTYTKTADNTYSLNYDVLDSTNTSIYSTPPDSVEVKFDPESGDMKTIDGVSTDSFSIKDSDEHLDFSIDLSKFDETSSASSSATSVNQESDVFNTLIRIRDDLRNGVKPSEEDEQILKDFNDRILDSISKAGNIQNRLSSTEELLSNQKSVYEEQYSNEQEVDLAQAVVDLQSLQTSLETAYEIAASIMDVSLLDYL